MWLSRTVNEHLRGLVEDSGRPPNLDSEGMAATIAGINWHQFACTVVIVSCLVAQGGSLL